ncbi:MULTISPECIES: hypothetical protein [unclassified Xanthomonas]|uniref:hypothetical protein n=1 Tax=Xanthomonas sp. LMG 9002 TaxID=1591158 RepID=UPI001F45BA00|nr:hypothetical protein [Xanthomonas sp. LMG 9002]
MRRLRGEGSEQAGRRVVLDHQVEPASISWRRPGWTSASATAASASARLRSACSAWRCGSGADAGVGGSAPP